MEVLSLVGGSLLSATFDLLFERLNGYLSDQLRNTKGEVRAQMEYWKTLLPKIIAILEHAEENQKTNRFMKLCLDDLRDLAYDMEDILEEFVIDAKRPKLNAKSKASTNKRQKVTSSLKNIFRFKAKPNEEINYRLKDITSRLQRIEKDLHTLGPINSAMGDKKESHLTAGRLPESSLLEDWVCGRDSDKKAILNKLLDDGGSLEQDFIIPIVGMAGLGKTTLARLIYNDEKLKARFDLKVWVCVSDEFDVVQITRTILEQVIKKKCVCDDFGSPQEELKKKREELKKKREELKKKREELEKKCVDFGSLQEDLKNELSGHKFLLVLDDVWNKEYGQWDVLKRPFMSGAPGSKIIVTTRNKDVGTMMRGDDGVYNLALLQDDFCLPLFTRHALGKENFDAHPYLQDAGKKLVKRCKRLPLALKTLAGILRGKLRRDEWENVLNSDIWSSSEDRSRILPALRLSYNHLPSYLKRCFAYCALFPQDYEFKEKELVLLWMAEGLLQQQSRRKKQIEEEIGHQCFHELLSRSLFQQSSTNKSRFVMHDLINDLAVDVAGEIYCNLERGVGDEKLEKTCYLSCTPYYHEFSERFRVFDKLKHLRTFLLLPEPCVYADYSHRYIWCKRILHEFLPTSNRLRVLSLCHYQIIKVPDYFENLKHIRYIDFSHTRIKCIPESVGSLLFLQTLLLSGCRQLSKLPMTIGNLNDLHHLDMIATSSLKEMPSEIGNLKNLLTLSKFIVGKDSGMMRLSDLKNLSQLQGRLCILGLQNVLDVQDAREAKLDNIHGLEELVLEWSTFDSDMEWTALDNDRDESVLEMQVLNWLNPHSNLKSLKISCYGGKNFPPWVYDPSLFSNLSSMKLRRCKRCTLLPSLGLLPVLKELIIEGMGSIEAIGFEFYGQHGSFPSLAELVFRNMPEWKEWSSPAGSAGEFPCLHKLVIENCPKLLGELPSNLSSLKELDVGRCNGKLLKSMGDVPSLTYLRIEQISELTCLSMSLPSLKELSIQDCNEVLLNSMVDLTSLTKLNIWQISKLTCLPMSVSLPSLKELSIRDCNGVLLKSMVDLTSLTSLEIAYLEKLTCLPESFTQSLTALETLHIEGCSDLTCLWEERTEIEQSLLPLNLKYLWLEDCGALESLPHAMMMRMDGSSNSNTSMLMSRLENLEICDCNSLKSFPRGKLPTSLKNLIIRDCEGLESLPNVDGDYNNSNLCLDLHGLPRVYSSQGSCHQLPTFLKEFTVTYGGEWLESFPEKMLQHCTRLQSISIENCETLKSLPNLDCVSNLVGLFIYRCEVLESLPGELALCTPNLKWLTIDRCDNFKSLPKTMYQLKSLQMLCMVNCPSIEFIPDGGLPPNLKFLELSCENLKCVPNSMGQLTSLENLSLLGEALTMDLQNLTSLRSLRIEHKLPLDIVLPSSLTSLTIWHEDNLESIPGKLFQNLSSLQCFKIVDCPKLRSLPKEAFFPSLAELYISSCPHLKQQRFEEKGDYWTLACSIPYVQIAE
ncbi:hypothetical protein SLEP1_g43139 [Rubroshorea leprosula]|uniref:Disease resistance RPP13-like protein 1 n=1 Tax=Rubroshorea leprosula TaxID=152421 RepID=A0AAV5LC29_9ROSI|nr:hypothetical protein SLEP1_g43139 [Rubroshorea leprosula]